MTATTADFLILGNRLCLDFINTEVVAGRVQIDRLVSFPDLVRWARMAGALDGGEADYVLERWGSSAEAEAAVETARGLRRRLRAIIDQVIGGSRAVPPEGVDAINQALRGRPGYLQLEADGKGWAVRWKVPLRRPEDVLWRVARSAASLLADDDLSLIRRCQRASCRLAFYDTTKNHRKRYCRMDVCGAAERSAAYYRRKAL